MAEVAKKVCLLGNFSVGKTSLVRRYVKQVFDESYLTTVGVKIDTKSLVLEQQPVKLVIWDIAGTDNLDQATRNYLRGAAGYLLVADGTRRDTLHSAIQLNRDISEAYGDLPFIALINKYDLDSEWEVDDHLLAQLSGMDWRVHLSSAKTGQSVDQAFSELTARILRH